MDKLINEKCRIGWELYGVYAESPDGSTYRVLFKVPCPERKALDGFARETKLTLQRLKNERQRAARALVDRFLDVVKVQSGLFWHSTKPLAPA